MKKVKDFITGNKKTVLIIFFVLVLLFGVTYSFFFLKISSSKNNVLVAGSLSVSLDENFSNEINISNAIPMSDSDGLETKAYSFSLKNDGTISSEYSIYLDDMKIDFDKKRMNDNYIRYSLEKNGVSANSSLLSDCGTNQNRVLDNGIISKNTTNTYVLRLWIDSNADNDVMGTVFKGHIRIEAIQDVNKPQKVTVSMPKNTTTERNFTWHTKSNNSSDVQIVKANGEKNTNLFSENALEYTGSVVDKTLDLYVHQAKATNLEAGVKYYYRVGDKEEDSWSSIGEFITDNGDDNFSFIYMADQQTSSSNSSKSLYTMTQAINKSANSEFILNAGDLLNNPTNKQEWLSNLDFNIYGNMTSINTAGNHDYKYTAEAIPNSLKNHFYYDSINDGNTESGLYYSLNYGNTHIVVLNTNSYWYGSIDSTQLEWLKSDLASPSSVNAKFRIVLVHRGPYTTGPHYYHYRDIQALTNQLTSIMDDYNVDLVFQGHDHTYALSYPINGDGSIDSINTSSVYSSEINQDIISMNNNSSPVYFIGGTAGTKYEPTLVKDGDNYVVDLIFNASYNVNINTEELDSYFSKFQKRETPRNENNIRLAMFSSISVSSNSIIVNSYTVDNQYHGDVKLYNSFAITK